MKQFRTYIKKVQSLALAAMLAAVVAAGAAPVASAAPAASAPFTAGAKVSFTFDDGLLSSFTEAAPVLAKYGFPGVNYITTDCIGMTTVPNDCPADNSHAYLTWQQVTELKNGYGWEIGSHSQSHPQLATDRINGAISVQQMADEISGSQSALAAQGHDALNFADPYGDYDNVSVREIAKHYTSHRGFHDIAQNVFPYNDYLLTVQQVQAGVSVETVKGYIDTAKQNGTWLVLVFHDIKNGTASADPADYEYNTADLDAIAAYVKQQNIPVTDIAHGLATSGTNLFANGSFTNGLADGWTTDSAGNVTADAAGNGSYPSATHSLAVTAGTGNAHIFSPIVDINAAETYIFKNYVNITAFGPGATTDSEVAFFVDEYDAAGLPIGGTYYPGIRYDANVNALTVKNINFRHTPSSASVAKLRLQVIVTAGSGIQAYYDNAQLFPLSAISTAEPTPTPTPKPGDINGDNLVDESDFSTLLFNWQKTGATKAQGDLSGDGVVDETDLSTLLFNWGK